MYIRTKNRIYQAESETCDKQGYFIGDYDVILKKQVINQSENLEELCDEFVEKCNDNPRIENPFVIPKWDKEFIKETLKRGNTIYGAIWTEWGLKYVAKMDSEGKLVLI